MILRIILINSFEKDPFFKNIGKTVIGELNKLSEVFLRKKTKSVQIYTLLNVEIFDEFDKYVLAKGRDIFLKRLSSEEIDYFLEDMDIYSSQYFNRFAMVHETNEEIVFSEKIKLHLPNDTEIKTIQELLIYSLTLLYTGSFAFNNVYQYYNDYYRFFGGSSISSVELNKNYSRIILDKNKFEKWMAKYNLLSNINISPFKLALSRLYEAERRTSGTDIIIDCVIALESLLLNDVGGEKIRGELKYRFSINYASLFPKGERKKQRDFANDVYDLRSMIIHGSNKLPTQFKLGNVSYNFADAAQSIKEMLRYTLNRLISFPESKGIMKKGFWIDRILNLE